MERRRNRRFRLSLPLLMTCRDRQPVTQSGVTHNISSGGVLFNSESEMELGASVEFVITLNASSEPIVYLCCFGNILRCTKKSDAEQSGYDIAATLERYKFVRKLTAG